MFRSSIGLHLLNRAFQVVNVGPAIKDLLAAYPITTSAALHPTENQVRFTVGRLLANGLYEGVTLVYDYLAKAWSYFVIADSKNALTGAMAADAVVRGTTYYWSSAGNGSSNVITGSLYSERLPSDPSAYWDGTVKVPLVVESAWVATNDIAGFQRIRRCQVLGTVSSLCDVTMSLGMDYEDAYTQSTVFPSIAATPVFQKEVHVGRQKCQAIRIKLEDSPTSGSGQGLTITRIVLRAGTKSGLQKLPAADRG
jgi:hypothetical protein